MLLEDLDRYIRSQLRIDDLAGTDKSLNGLQVGRRDKEIEHCAVAVDAALETFRRSAESGADMLFVHHGIFWGSEQPVTGMHYERIRFLIENDIALYACHLPLDMHPEFGNNAEMAEYLGLQEIEPFGDYRGRFTIGFKGSLPEARRLDDVVRQLFGSPDEVLGILRFGSEQVRHIGIVSGGAPGAVHEAIEDGLDLYITGDASHTVYHPCMEAGMNMVFGGHYLTETWGVRGLARRLEQEHGIRTSFIDVPTGL